MESGSLIRRTKIVCTIGPASNSPEIIEKLILSGMNVARLNFSHGQPESHKKTIRLIRRIDKKLGRETGILQDLGGPKIRLGLIPGNERTLQTGEKISLSPTPATSAETISVNYPYLLEDVAAGDRILMADGRVELRIVKKSPDSLTAEVMVGGTIHSHKGINLPSTSLRVPAFTDKDKKDLLVGLEHRVDFVALSFVRNEKDLEPAKKILEGQQHKPLLIAKIEKPQAIDRFGQILARVDSIMVARGDLGVEMPLEKVPILQKHIIDESRKAGKPVITATQMLGSMTDNPRPTRAEATDVANAVLDGTDAVMLSDETAIGKYPIEAVGTLDRISRAAESSIDWEKFLEEPLSPSLPSTETAISRSACRLAQDLKVAGIIAFTSSGSTARLVSRFRPPFPIIALTNRLYTQRQLNLSWGIVSGKVRSFKNADSMFVIAGRWARENRIAKKGDRLIVTAGIPAYITGTTNLLRILDVD